MRRSAQGRHFLESLVQTESLLRLHHFMFKTTPNKIQVICLALSIVLTACGGGNGSSESTSFNTPQNAQTIAFQKEGALLNEKELTSIAETGVRPVPFDGPLLSGATDLSGNHKNSLAMAQSQSSQINAAFTTSVSASSLATAYRFYNPTSTGHFYTTNIAERDSVKSNNSSFIYEGPAFFASSENADGLSPVHRFYNRQTGVHFYTISEAERAFVVANLSSYLYEGIAYFASPVGGQGLMPLYRFYKPGGGFHFYTSSVAERDQIIATLPAYSYEGIGYYVMSSDWMSNAAPVANAGVAQNVVAGSTVTLDGSASSDANSDPLTYAWTLTSKPAGSAAALSSSTSVKPTFTADVAGTYVGTLTVSDVKVNSTAATITITAIDDIPPVPVGSGILAASIYDDFFYKIDAITGVMTKLPFACYNMRGGDIAPDGRVIVNTGNKTVSLVDPIGGKCRTLFDVPEQMWGLAVAPDGTIITISMYTTFGQYQVYRYRRDGTLLSKAAIQGSLEGGAAIDFAPDGSLCSNNFKLDPITGSVTASSVKCAGGGIEMDIDALGYMRSISSDYLSVYDTYTGQLVRKTLLQFQFRGQGPIIYR